MQRTVKIAGHDIIISVLGAPLDKLFERFHAQYFAHDPSAWDTLTDAAIEHFTQHRESPDHDAYFNSFISLWHLILAVGRYDEAEHLWHSALQPALTWEGQHAGQFLHKGTPYYLWATTVLLKGDIDCGYLLIHRAVEEDIRTAGRPVPDTPGYALVSLNYDKTDQLFRNWVLTQKQLLDSYVTNYATTHQRALTIDDVKRRFLDQPPDTETVFLLTYALARLMNIFRLPDDTTKNRFAGQLELNLLFDLTLVIDTSIKKKSNQPYFREQAAHLLNAAGHPLSIQQLGRSMDSSSPVSTQHSWLHSTAPSTYQDSP